MDRVSSTTTRETVSSLMNILMRLIDGMVVLG